MNINKAQPFPAYFVVVLALICGFLFPSAYSAGTQVKPAQKRASLQHPHRVERGGAEADLLRKAYIALSRADHDYDGHRLKAMGQTSEAARILGETLAGDGHDREAQMTSDAELREANAFLQSARSMAASHKRPRVVEHINAAIRQISIALKIR
jgi:hypothetical protein